MIDNLRPLVKGTCNLLRLSPRRYYRWKSRYEEDDISGLEDKDPEPSLPYNKILSEDRESILKAADKYIRT